MTEELQLGTPLLHMLPVTCLYSADVIEELMGQEILDETDKFADNTRTVEVNEETR